MTYEIVLTTIARCARPVLDGRALLVLVAMAAVAATGSSRGAGGGSPARPDPDTTHPGPHATNKETHPCTDTEALEPTRARA